jgi:hypothetical protein
MKACANAFLAFARLVFTLQGLNQSVKRLEYKMTQDSRGVGGLHVPEALTCRRQLGFASLSRL